MNTHSSDYVASIDYDGCLVHEFNCERFNFSRCIASNVKLIQFFIAKKQQHPKAMMYIGSARQSKKLDDMNSSHNNTTSCFTIIHQLSQYVAYQYNPFLLADVFGQHPYGTAWERATNPRYLGSHVDIILDPSKLALLYAQLHHHHQHHASQCTHFDFFDDREDLLDPLIEFFSRYPQMIPRKTILRLMHYDGNDLTLKGTIRGQGDYDVLYEKTTHQITRLIKQNLINNNTPHDGVTPQSIRQHNITQEPSVQSLDLFDNTSSSEASSDDSNDAYIEPEANHISKNYTLPHHMMHWIVHMDQITLALSLIGLCGVGMISTQNNQDHLGSGLVGLAALGTLIKWSVYKHKIDHNKADDPGCSYRAH